MLSCSTPCFCCHHYLVVTGFVLTVFVVMSVLSFLFLVVTLFVVTFLRHLFCHLMSSSACLCHEFSFWSSLFLLSLFGSSLILSSMSLSSLFVVSVFVVTFWLSLFWLSLFGRYCFGRHILLHCFSRLFFCHHFLIRVIVITNVIFDVISRCPH